MSRILKFSRPPPIQPAHPHSTGSRRSVFGPTFVGNLTAHDERGMDAQHARLSRTALRGGERLAAPRGKPGPAASEPDGPSGSCDQRRPTPRMERGHGRRTTGAGCPRYPRRQTARDGRKGHGRPTTSRMTVGRAAGRRISSWHRDPARDGRGSRLAAHRGGRDTDPEAAHLYGFADRRRRGSSRSSSRFSSRSVGAPIFPSS